MSGRRHPCPVTLPGGADCGVMIAGHLLMDGAHWRMVPAALQREVYATRGGGTYPRGLTAYRDACRAAIEDVEEQLFAAASVPKAGRR